MNRFCRTFSVLMTVFAATAGVTAAQSPIDALGDQPQTPDPVGDASHALPNWNEALSGRGADDPPGFSEAPVGMARPPGLPSAPTQVPVDGGLGLLAAAGGSYAVRRLRTSR